uniref:FBA domain-containing protein n=1 Tax=Cuerna arida TaxID=1464854 RepID=A0A1B6EY49_9HEMI
MSSFCLDNFCEGNPNEINGFVLSNILLPEDVVLTILSAIKWTDLKACRLVCNSWRSLIDSFVCCKKLKSECRDFLINYSNPVSELYFKHVPFYIYYAIGKKCFHRNLLKNVFGSGADQHVCDMVLIVDESGFDDVFNDYFQQMVCSTVNCPKFEHWKLTASGGEGWAVENVADGSDPVPEYLEEHSCFVTSYYTCTKQQLINLKQYGLSSRIMDEIQPHFELCDWYTARTDCGGIYRIKVTLLNAEEEPIAMFEHGKTIQRFAGGQWQKVSHTFKDYGPGVRYILFEHGGEDTDWIGGHSGMKMTGSSVVAKLAPDFFQMPCDFE